MERLSSAKHLGEAFDRGFGRVIDQNKRKLPRKGLTIQAHPDDNALAEGAIETLAREGVALTALTLTDGGARDLKWISNEDLVPKRIPEDFLSFEISGIAEGYHVGMPHDGELQEHEEQGIAAVQGIIVATDPEFIIVTNHMDQHDDHSSAGRIALEAANGEIPVYMMDTVTQLDVNGNHLDPTHAFEISFATKLQRDSAYKAHRTQTLDLPPYEMEDVNRVIELPHERGKQHGVPRAAVLFHAGNAAADPIGKWLENKRIK
jgi:LmbE family N-acetylglucosaminyl deacetylase